MQRNRHENIIKKYLQEKELQIAQIHFHKRDCEIKERNSRRISSWYYIPYSSEAIKNNW